jgi:hypothetical protein
MILPSIHAKLNQMLGDLGERLSERRLLRALARLENSSSEDEKDDAFRRLTQLLSRDPRALNAYIGQRELEAQLITFLDDSSFQTS